MRPLTDYRDCGYTPLMQEQAIYKAGDVVTLPTGDLEPVIKVYGPGESADMFNVSEFAYRFASGIFFSSELERVHA